MAAKAHLIHSICAPRRLSRRRCMRCRKTRTVQVEPDEDLHVKSSSAIYGLRCRSHQLGHIRHGNHHKIYRTLIHHERTIHANGGARTCDTSNFQNPTPLC